MCCNFLICREGNGTIFKLVRKMRWTEQNNAPKKIIEKRSKDVRKQLLVNLLEFLYKR